MRIFILSALLVGLLGGCYTMTEREYVARMNANKKIWPPVVEGQAFPVQEMWSEH